MAEIELATRVQMEQRVPLSRGVIAEPTDLDMLREIDAVGSYSGRLEFLVNAPAGLTGNPLCTFDVQRNANNSVRQVLYCPGQGVYYRLASTGTAFYAWERFVEGSEVSLLAPVISEDAYAPLLDGQTLYRIDPGVTMTDFENAMSGFQYHWGNIPYTWVRNTNPNLLGGRGMVWEGAGTGFASWTRYGPDFVDGDVLARFASPSFTQYQATMIMVRGQGGINTKNGYGAFVYGVDDQVWVTIGRYADNTYTRLGRSAISLAPEEPYFVRFSAKGEALRARAWRASDVEPDAWHVTVSDSHRGSGRVGIYQAGGVRSAFDVLSVNTAGGRA